MLLDAGADADAEDKKKRTPLDFAQERNPPAPEVVEMLRAIKVAVQKAKTNSAFLRRCANGTAEEVRQDLKLGANIGAQDEQGMTKHSFHI